VLSIVLVDAMTNVVCGVRQIKTGSDFSGLLRTAFIEQKEKYRSIDEVSKEIYSLMGRFGTEELFEMAHRGRVPCIASTGKSSKVAPRRSKK